MSIAGVFSLILAMYAAPVLAAECTEHSGPQRVALLELYTSEGCSSCPPADHWLSSLEQRGYTPDKVIPIALHVDYWDTVGWTDRFASPAYSARQHEQAALGHSTFVYTPQVMLNGRDYRGWRSDSTFVGDIDAIHRSPARADINLKLATTQGKLTVKMVAHGPAGATLYLALVENGLSSEVGAGENSGKKLNHDHVVRVWRGPFEMQGEELEIALDPGWNGKNMMAVAFVQNRSGGEVLQAMTLGLCR